jgi:hypothetical protein
VALPNQFFRPVDEHPQFLADQLERPVRYVAVIGINACRLSFGIQYGRVLHGALQIIFEPGPKLLSDDLISPAHFARLLRRYHPDPVHAGNALGTVRQTFARTTQREVPA